MPLRLELASLLLFGLLASSQTMAGEFEPEHLFRGTGETGIVVNLGTSDIPLKARGFACANCHGSGGEGGIEGTSKAPALTGLLTSLQLYESVAQGISPEGKPLSAAMPRFKMTREQSSKMFAYLQRLEMAERQGISETSVKIGFQRGVLPIPLEDSMIAKLKAAIAAFNTNGTVFGRKLELLELANKVSPETSVFALVGPLGYPRQTSLSPLHIFPVPIQNVGNALRLDVYFALPFADLAGGFAEKLMQRGTHGCLILLGGSAGNLELAEAIQDRLRKKGTSGDMGCQVTQEIPPLDTKLPRTVVVLAAQNELISHWLSLAKPEAVYATVEVASTLLPLRRKPQDTHLVADPYGPYSDMAVRRGVPMTDVLMESAVVILAEGLGRSGRSLTRQGFLASLMSSPVELEPGVSLDFAKHPGWGFSTVRFIALPK